MKKMRELPINDFFSRNGQMREDGRMVHDMFPVQVKKPSESKCPWDYYTVKAVIRGNEAFRPLTEGVCPLVKKIVSTEEVGGPESSDLFMFACSGSGVPCI